MGDFDVRLIPIADLRDHPRNSNRHGEHQMAVLQARFAALGWYKNVVVAEHEGAYTLLAGHGITRGAEAAGETSAPCHVRQIDPLSPEALDILEGDNTVAELADPDLEQRLRNLIELDEAGRLGNVGFDDGALERLKSELQADEFGANHGPELLPSDDADGTGSRSADYRNPGAVIVSFGDFAAVAINTETMQAVSDGLAAMYEGSAREQVQSLLDDIATQSLHRDA